MQASYKNIISALNYRITLVPLLIKPLPQNESSALLNQILVIPYLSKIQIEDFDEKD